MNITQRTATARGPARCAAALGHDGLRGVIGRRRPDRRQPRRRDQAPRDLVAALPTGRRRRHHRDAADRRRVRQGSPGLRAQPDHHAGPTRPTSRSTRRSPRRTSCPSCSTPTPRPSRRSSRTRARWSTSTLLLEDLGLVRRLPRGGAELPALRRRVALHGARSSSSWSSSGTTRRCSSRPACRSRRRSTTSPRRAKPLRGRGRHPDRPRRPGPVAARALHGLLPVPPGRPRVRPEAQERARRRSATRPAAQPPSGCTSSARPAASRRASPRPGYCRRAGPVHVRQGRDVQHRHLGAGQPRHGRARRRRPRLRRLLHPADDRRRRHGRQRVRDPVGHRHGRQREDLRPARARLPRVRPGALPRGLRRLRARCRPPTASNR